MLCWNRSLCQIQAVTLVLQVTSIYVLQKPADSWQVKIHYCLAMGSHHTICLPGFINLLILGSGV